jgi:hypothetical protein
MLGIFYQDTYWLLCGHENGAARQGDAHHFTGHAWDAKGYRFVM